ncbi:hypothetical protein EHI8A_079070 [Entamoeba histolytica HM-1:IMSS-B]|uniref:Vesicle transport protein n=6 Tax=Entamoeba histolytica TaxID=5759 RepID=C4LZB5_ENTH1|nr:hypothetical protein, conserved [Entamoeba histolytica HM-1:IMSS]EMD49394.1 vesicle transport protein SFT2A, putative [Entamoeba histolytica KU27]EMH75826.1 hypothetical protein EHI8A_079070 [Entamoeba histolytica HM-1:IMSS-B]EMS12230.1 vesicle transport protein SFT2A, putative [Entamoeba histolytica HM-3:IMSS]ENY62113.1 vesicle transport protein SFT2A, putative [Entamoeba histolytica HM-1:IMSS-A]GAT94196.1 hypothetical protein conserved [Entamoeba histolytica]|eukprot:XP_653195.1 hypothetical protein, conserved [Entamoeba histolytica HM-1:IMSS]
MLEDPLIPQSDFDDTSSFTIENPCDKLGFHLSTRNRIITFFLIFSIAIFFWLVTFPFILVFVAAPYLFMICYSLGLLLISLATFFLYSPLTQFKLLKQPLRLLCAIVFLCCLTMTILGLFLFKNSIVVLFFLIIQIATTIFYSFSLLPFSSKCILEFCGKNQD